MSSQNNKNNVNNIFGATIGLGGLAAPYTQKALEQRLKMLKKLRAFLALVFSIAPKILTDMQTVEKMFYKQDAQQLTQQALGQFVSGGIGVGTSLVGLVGGIKEANSGANLSKESEIYSNFAERLRGPYTPDAITIKKIPTMSDANEIEMKDFGNAAAASTDSTPVHAPNEGQARNAAENLLNKTKMLPEQGSTGARTGVRGMKYTQREKAFDELNRNSDGNASVREEYAKKFDERASKLKTQADKHFSASDKFSQISFAISQAVGPAATAYFTYKQAQIKHEQASSAAAKQASSMMDSQNSTLDNNSIGQLKAFQDSLEKQVSIDSQMNQRRG
jgi:hypothetical protein